MKSAKERQVNDETTTSFEESGSRSSSSPIGDTIRQRRKALGRTLSQVAHSAQLTTGFLSQVERGISGPSVSSLMAIAIALDTTIEELVRINKEFKEYVPEHARQKYVINSDGRVYEKLGPGFPGALFYPMIIHRPPGHVSERMCHPGEVFCFLISGQIQYYLGQEVHIMRSGDVIHHDTSKPHYSKVIGDSQTVELWVSSRPSSSIPS